MSKTKTIKSDKLAELTKLLEDSNIKVTTKDNSDNCINLKLVSEDALTVIATNLKQYNELGISTDSVIDGNSYDIYVEVIK